MIIRKFAIDSVSRHVEKTLRNQIHTIFCANVFPYPHCLNMLEGYNIFRPSDALLALCSKGNGGYLIFVKVWEVLWQSFYK